MSAYTLHNSLRQRLIFSIKGATIADDFLDAIRMSNIGLARNQVELISHQNNWSALFADEAKRIKAAINNPSLQIEHVGSTAIPGIYAKPIIDIAIPYTDITVAENYIQSLEQLGYQYKGEEGVAGRFFFVKGPEGKREFYLHLVDTKEFNKLIKFRNKLRKDTELAQQYSELKLTLTKSFPTDRKSYTRAKSNFISEVLLNHS